MALSTNALGYIRDSRSLYTLDVQSMQFGNIGDGVKLAWDGSNTLNINAVTANDTVRFGSSTNTDVRLDGGTAGADVHWDASADTLNMLAGSTLHLGAVADGVDVKFDGADTLNIDAANANDAVRLGETTLTDFQVDCATATNDFLIDASADQVFSPPIMPTHTVTDYADSKAASDAITANTFETALVGGIITSTTAAAVSMALPAAADLLAVVPNARVGTCVKCHVINLGGANAITITDAGDASITIDTDTDTVAAGLGATLIIRFTNVTASSEAAVAYLC